ncbi:hypothetical protein C8R46DRAFT_1357692 [Mycena filopes]|nr:hypothetical protein C8R46DRAFT_1357692 [Mycena filopes]
MFTLPLGVLVLGNLVLGQDIVPPQDRLTTTVVVEWTDSVTLTQTVTETSTSTYTGLVTSTSSVTHTPPPIFDPKYPPPPCPTNESLECNYSFGYNTVTVNTAATLVLVEFAPANNFPATRTKTGVSTQPTATPASSQSSTGAQSRSRSKRTQALVGGLLGGLSAVGIALAILFMLRRRRLGRTQPHAWQVFADPEAAPGFEGGSDSGTSAVDEKPVLEDDGPQPTARTVMETAPPLAAEMSGVANGADATEVSNLREQVIPRAQELESLPVGRPASDPPPGYFRFEAEPPPGYFRVEAEQAET